MAAILKYPMGLIQKLLELYEQPPDPQEHEFWHQNYDDICFRIRDIVQKVIFLFLALKSKMADTPGISQVGKKFLLKAKRCIQLMKIVSCFYSKRLAHYFFPASATWLRRLRGDELQDRDLPVVAGETGVVKNVQSAVMGRWREPQRGSEWKQVERPRP